MSTISPSLQIGGVNGWKGKEGAVLGWQQTSGGLFKPAKFDFTRLSGSASYTDENGLIQIEHRPNYPRFTYQDGKQCLMNEEARTNLNLYSEDFDAATTDWTENGLSVTNDSSTSPDGNTTADELIESGLNEQHKLNGAPKSVTTGEKWAISVFAKANTRSVIQIVPSSTSFGASTYANFDLSAGEVSASANCTTTIESFSNGWYRCILITQASTTTVSTGVSNFFIQDSPTAARSASYAGDGSSGLFIWGAQAEENVSYASSYIPTSGSAVTRAAESIEGLNLGNFLGDSQGGLYAEVLAFDVGNFNAISLSDGTTNNRAFFNMAADSMFFNFVSGGTTEVNYQGTTILDNTFYKVAFGYAPNDYAGYLDGSQETTDTSLSTFASDTLTEVKGDSGAGGSDFRGLIHEIRAYNQRPANSQMETQTT